VDDDRAVVLATLDEHLELMRAVRDDLADDIAGLAADITRALDAGGSVLAFGNGGSAADAQHLAAELLGRFGAERRPLSARSLAADPSTVTAIANDFGFADIFARQIEALCGPTDIAIAFSTSGESENVVRGAVAASRIGARTWALTGHGGGQLARVCARSIVVPSATTARIQEAHAAIVHAVCELVDRWAVDPAGASRTGPA
jgi:D-sedoheptulose 7-phosphate isomerase